MTIDQAVAHAFLNALTPSVMEATLLTEVCYRMVDPENRPVARGLEAEWRISSEISLSTKHRRVSY
jgi:hypothetical protein